MGRGGDHVKLTRATPAPTKAGGEEGLVGTSLEGVRRRKEEGFMMN
jgi:hypothetical protein